MYETKEYKNCSNLPMFFKVARAKPLHTSKMYNHQSWTHPPIEWIKFNTNASEARTNHMTAISYVVETHLGE